MKHASNEPHDLLDERIVKGIFEEHILPSCEVGTVIEDCRRGWSRHQPERGASEASYHVTFTSPSSGRRFTRQIHLVATRDSPGRLPGMAEIGELSPGDPLRISYRYIDERELLVQVFPTDLQLPHLRVVATPESVAPYLTPYTGLNNGQLPRVAVLNYKPGKRCTLRYDFSTAEGAALVGKVFYREKAQALGVMKFLHPALPIPKPHVYIPELHFLLMEALPGRKLSVKEPDIIELMDSAAKVTRTLHQLPIQDNASNLGLPTRSLDDQVYRFNRNTERLRQRVPMLERQITTLTSAVLEQLRARWADRLCLVHGDLKINQFLVNGSQLGLIDFDSFHFSHPVTDISEFLAFMEWRGRTHPEYAERTRVAASVFLKKYLEDDQFETEALLPVFKAMQFLRMACRRFQRQRPGHQQYIPVLLEMAAREVGGPSN